jgi:ADP-ribose pyrophosphatase YjhB (NUDIX family)
MIPDLLLKVIAYVTREREGRTELLVFKHRDSPEAGVQVPAGTMHEGESPEEGLVREVLEETGLGDLEVGELLAVYEIIHPVSGRTHRRHVFHMTAPAKTPDAWEWLETGGGEMTEEEGFLFQLYWVDLQGQIELAGNQGDYLPLLRERLAQKGVPGES